MQTDSNCETVSFVRNSRGLRSSAAISVTVPTKATCDLRWASILSTAAPTPCTSPSRVDGRTAVLATIRACTRASSRRCFGSVRGVTVDPALPIAAR